MNKDIPQATACEKALSNIRAARKALSDAANPSEDTISITIRGLDSPITGELSLWRLPPGTSIHVAMRAPALGAVYVRASSSRPQRWMRHDGLQVTGVDVFAALLDATRCDGAITLLSYGLDPL